MPKKRTKSAISRLSKGGNQKPSEHQHAAIAAERRVKSLRGTGADPSGAGGGKRQRVGAGVAGFGGGGTKRGPPTARKQKKGGKRQKTAAAEEASKPARSTKQPAVSKAKSRAAAAAAAKLPVGLGRTPASRASAFMEGDGEPDERALQRMRYAVKVAAAPLLKLLKKGGGAQAGAVLGGLARHPELRPLLPVADVRLGESDDLRDRVLSNVRNTLGEAAERGTADSQQFRGAVVTAAVDGVSPRKRGRGGEPRVRARREDASPAEPPLPMPVEATSKLLGLKPGAGRRLQKRARAKKRLLLESPDSAAYLLEMRRHGRPLQGTAGWAEKIWRWLEKHPNIIVMPYDTLLVRGADGKRNVRVPRLESEVSVGQLFRDAEQELGDDGRLPFLERTFINLLPKCLRRHTQRRESAGCATCTRMRRLHSALRVFRRTVKARLGPRSAYDPPDHERPSDALAAGLPQGCLPLACGLRPAHCWLRQRPCCGGVEKRYVIPPLERKRGRDAEKITFSTYEAMECDPSPHDEEGAPPRKRQVLVKKTLPIGDFHTQHYIPGLVGYDVHYNHLEVDRFIKANATFPCPGDAEEEADWAMRLTKTDDMEGAEQGEHWNNESAGMESAIGTSYSRAEVDAYVQNGVVPAADPADAHVFHITPSKKQALPVSLPRARSSPAPLRALLARRIRPFATVI